MYPILFEVPDWFPVLGGEPITSFGVFMLLAFVTAGFVLRAELRRTGEDPEKAWDFVFWAVIGGILGAKVYYIFLNYPRLATDPAALIFARGGLVWYGGFLGATALIVWEIRRSGMGIGRTFDAMTPPLAIAYAVGRIGCFLVGDDWGRPTAAWYGIAFPRGTPPTRADVIEGMGISVDPALIAEHGPVVPVHPTQLYEVALSTLIFLFLWRIRDHRRHPGWLFALWLVLAGAGRFLVEFVRAKDDRFFGVMTLAQVLSVAVMLVGLAYALRLRDARQAE